MRYLLTSRRTATGPRKAGGVTLIELTIVCGLTALLATAVCGVYIYALRLWERGQAENSAYMAASIGMDRIAKLTENAVDAQIQWPGYLMIVLPRDKESNGDYIPYRAMTGQLMYRPGDQIIFYLSDNTGTYPQYSHPQASHDILWRSVNAVRDRSWSLHPGTHKGRVAPVQALSFEVTSIGTRKLVRITIQTRQTSGKHVHQLTLNRYVRLRNYNPTYE